MLRYLAIVLYILFAVPAISQNRVQMLVRHLPAAHDTSGNIYVAGSFNGWSAEATPMHRGDDAAWRATVKLSEGIHHYTFDYRFASEP